MTELSQVVKVSVLVPAYNMAPYLGQCLDSIIAQQVNFTYQILVAEDCSTDNTKEIAEVYEKKYPDLIKVFYNTINLGASRNLCKLIERADTELFVQVDGDDYLIDKNKLQTQADLMDEHADYAICYHNYTTVDSAGNNPKEHDPPFKGSCILPKDYLLYHELGPGNVVMIRRNALPKIFPEWMYTCGYHVDYMVHCLAAASGRIYYIDKVMSAYRKHPASVTTVTKLKNILEMRALNPEKLAGFYRSKRLYAEAAHFDLILPQRYMILGYFYLSEGEILNFIHYFFKGFIKQPNFKLSEHKDMIYTASPNLAQRLKRWLRYR